MYAPCYFLSPHHPNAPRDRVKKVKPYEMKTRKERNWKCEKWQLVPQSATVSDCLAVSKWNSPAARSNREGQQVKVHAGPYCCVTSQFKFPVAQPKDRRCALVSYVHVTTDCIKLHIIVNLNTGLELHNATCFYYFISLNRLHIQPESYQYACFDTHHLTAQNAISYLHKRINSRIRNLFNLGNRVHWIVNKWLCLDTDRTNEKSHGCRDAKAGWSSVCVFYAMWG